MNPTQPNCRARGRRGPLALIAFASALLAGSPASAQWWGLDFIEQVIRPMPPRPPGLLPPPPERVVPPGDVVRFMASRGFQRISRPALRDGLYLIDGIDRAGDRVRFVIDARDGRVLRANVVQDWDVDLLDRGQPSRSPDEDWDERGRFRPARPGSDYTERAYPERPSLNRAYPEGSYPDRLPSARGYDQDLGAPEQAWPRREGEAYPEQRQALREEPQGRSPAAPLRRESIPAQPLPEAQPRSEGAVGAPSRSAPAARTTEPSSQAKPAARGAESVQPKPAEKADAPANPDKPATAAKPAEPTSPAPTAGRTEAPAGKPDRSQAAAKPAEPTGAPDKTEAPSDSPAAPRPTIGDAREDADKSDTAEGRTARGPVRIIEGVTPVLPKADPEAEKPETYAPSAGE